VEVKSLIGLLLGDVGVFSEAGWEVSTGEVVERDCSGAAVVLLIVAIVGVKGFIGLVIRGGDVTGENWSVIGGKRLEGSEDK